MTNDQLFTTADGSHSLLSGQYDVSFHSRFGAIGETRHVFIQAALLHKALHQSQLAVLGMGFGTGLNAYMSLLAAVQQHLQIDYHAIEAFPIDPLQARQLNYPRLLEADPLGSYFYQLHDCPWDIPQPISPNFTFTKRKMHFENIPFDQSFDIIYYDAFAPDAQPELWTESMLARCFKALLPGGVLTTYCAKGAVKRALKAVGFELESLAGPPGKREMTRATKP